MTSIKYNLLFTLELLHAFNANRLCTDFVIVPSAKTAAVLGGYKMVVKQYENKLYTGIAANNDGTPIIKPAEGTPFTFFLQLTNPLFFNYTNLPFAYPPGKLYYFTNRVSNSSNSKQFLSLPTPFINTKEYKPGDIATNAGGTTFQAIRTSTGTAPAPGNFWMEVDDNHYFSEKDALQLLPAISTYQFTAAQPSANIEVHGFNPADPEAYDTLVYADTIIFEKPASAFTLNLSVLPPGKYKVSVNGNEQAVYLSDELNTNKAFAVIDLYNESTLPADYQLLNGDNLLAPLYSIFFLNRATIWKYVLTSATATVSDNASVYQFSSPAPHQVLSLSPIPLQEKALNLTLAIGAQEYTPVACASPQRLAKHISGSDTYYCSEIFINY